MTAKQAAPIARTYEIGLGKMRRHAQELLERGLALGLDAQHLGQLGADDDQRQAVHEADDHRLGQEVGDEAQPQQAAQQAEHADHEAEIGGQQREPHRVALGHRDQGDGDDRRHRRIGADDQLPRAANRA